MAWAQRPRRARLEAGANGHFGAVEDLSAGRRDRRRPGRRPGAVDVSGRLVTWTAAAPLVQASLDPRPAPRTSGRARCRAPPSPGRSIALAAARVRRSARAGGQARVGPPWPPASPSRASPTTTPARPPRPAASSSPSRPAPRSSTSARYSFDPARPAGQHRALHRRRPGPDRDRRPAARQRRARPGRVLRPDGDRRGHARRLLQPRHEAAARGRRREDDDHGRPHAARAGVPVRRAPARRATSASGSTSTSTRSSEAAEATTQVGQAAGHRAVLGQPHPLHALQLHDRRRRRPEHDRQGDRRPRAHWILEQLPRRSSTSSSSRTSRPTRRARRSTCCARAASASSPRRRSRTRCSSEIMHSTSELMYRARQVSNLGGFMSGVNNNGAHSANGITAMFIATGQDVANVAESSRRLRLRRAARRTATTTTRSRSRR